MIAIEFSFPGGRMHATPWGRHVNEGEVEWPPSSWRLLRALIATWHMKCQGRVDEMTLRQILNALASELPQYEIPVRERAMVGASLGHTRHYMPLYEYGKSAKVLDTFVHLDNGAVVNMVWPGLELEPALRDTLGLLLSRLGYLGRAESWVEARLRGSWNGACNVRPLVEGAGAPTDGDVVRMLAPESAEVYAAWRIARAAATVGNGKKKKGGVELPDDLYAALHADTGELRAAGWSQPPGARWVEYVRPVDPFGVVPDVAGRRRAAQSEVHVARYAVVSKVPPRLTKALWIGERIHQTLVKLCPGDPLVRGTDGDGAPLAGHEHLRVMCESNDRVGHITHVTLHSSVPFSSELLRVLHRVREVRGFEDYPIHVVLLGTGGVADFAGNDVGAGECPLLRSSAVWESRTPFVPTRFAKTYNDGRPKIDEANGLQIGCPAHDLLRLLEVAGLPRVLKVEAVEWARFGGRDVSWLDFRVFRKSGGGRRAGNRGYGFRLMFERSVTGPLALGYGAHLGLGMFGPRLGSVVYEA